jgi:catechol 2,3-dioxygenase-like lactoylglutathione lyase family enzyme
MANVVSSPPPHGAYLAEARMTSEAAKPGGIVLAQVNLVMAAAVDFYRLLGVDIPTTEPGWDEHHRTAAVGFVASDALDFEIDSREFAAYWAGELDEPVATRPVIGFRVATREAVDDLYQRVTSAGHTGRRAPYDTFWGARYAIVEDPDGTPVGLMSPSTEAHRTSPPSPGAFAG